MSNYNQQFGRPTEGSYVAKADNPKVPYGKVVEEFCYNNGVLVVMKANGMRVNMRPGEWVEYKVPEGVRDEDVLGNITGESIAAAYANKKPNEDAGIAGDGQEDAKSDA